MKQLQTCICSLTQALIIIMLELCYCYVSRVMGTGHFERHFILRNPLYFLACVVSGYEGCHENVIDILDNACSGKQKCDFPVFNTDLDNIKPCIGGLTVYLEVSYKCVAGKPILVIIHFERKC